MKSNLTFDNLLYKMIVNWFVIMPKISIQEIGKRWEQGVRNFFNQMGFTVDGGQNFFPGGIQIDVVAGIGNTLLIGECKTKEELGERSNLASEIRKFKKNIKTVIKGFQEDEKGKGYHSGKYKYYTHFQLFIATKDIVYQKPDIEACKEKTAEDPYSQRLLYCRFLDEDYLNYYLNLKEELSGEIAKYQLLADLSMHLQHKDIFKVVAVKNIIKGCEVYNFVSTPQDIMEYVTVARRQAKQKQYYQRMIDGDRCQDIIDYLDTPDYLFPKGQIIPGNIILATDPNFLGDVHESRKLSFQPVEIADYSCQKNTEVGILEFPAWYGPFWIVDGQHRLYAFCKHSKINFNRQIQLDDKVAFTLLHGLTISQQSQIFVDINDEQIGVPFEYILDIEGDANPNYQMGRISNVIKLLDTIFEINYDGKKYENIFYKKIKIPSHGIKRKFSMRGFYYALKRKNLIPIDKTDKKTSSDFENPFFCNISISDKKRMDIEIVNLSENLILFFSMVKNILNDEMKKSYPLAKYNLDYMLNARGKDGFIDVMIGLYARIITAKRKAINKISIPNAQDFIKYLQPIAKRLAEIKNEEDYVSFINTSGHGNRLDTERRFCHVIKEAGHREFDFNDIDFDINSIAERCTQLEETLRELINQILITVDIDWCKGKRTDLLPGEIYRRLWDNAKGDFQRNPDLIEQGRLYRQLDLGQCRDLILKHWKLGFDKMFVVKGDKFRDKDQFQEAFKHLSLYRNTPYHGRLSDEERKIIRETDQKILAESYLKTFNKVFQSLDITDFKKEDYLDE